MKKTISLILTACMLFCALCLASCQKPETLTTAEKVSQALEATRAFDTYSAILDMKIDMDMQGISMEIPATIDMKVKDANSEQCVSFMEMEMEMMGMTISMPIYMEGEWVYLSMFGENMKMKAEDYTDTNYTESAEGMLEELSENLFEDKELVKNADGSETVTVSVPDETFAEIYDEVLETVKESAASGEEVTNLSIENAQVSYTIKDGLLSAISMDWLMEMDVAGMTVSVDVVYDMTYNAFGDDVVITPPEGYQDYPEISDEGMLE